MPRAGSAYVYSYVTVGEMLAWTTGWQLLLEYVIGASSVARAWSGYVDSLAGGAVTAAITRGLGVMSVPGLAATPDFLGAGMTLLLSAVVSVGVKESTGVNNVLTAINLLVIIFVIIAGAFYVDTANYAAPSFAPMGFTGIFKGAATSFYAYVGFDVIATSAEETINPARNIPVSIITSLVLCCAAYVGVSAVVTLMVPWNLLDHDAPLSAAFASHGAVWAKYVIAIGAVCGLSTSLMTCIFPMPRIIYAISSDGLLPAWIGAVHPRFNTPVVATMLCGSFAAAMCLIFDIEALADMMSIGTLISYTLVAASVLVLRYREYEEQEDAGRAAAAGAGAVATAGSTNSTASGKSGGSGKSGAAVPRAGAALPLLDDEGLCAGTSEGGVYEFRGMRPFRAAAWALLVYTVGLSIASAATVVYSNADAGSLSASASAACIAFIAIGLAVTLAGLAVLLLLPRGVPLSLSFQCPGMPAVPLVSIAINVYLLVSLSPFTWIRFGVWCLIGAFIYMGYGIKHSKAGLEAADKAAAAAGAGAVEEGEDEGEDTPLTRGGK